MIQTLQKQIVSNGFAKRAADALGALSQRRSYTRPHTHRFLKCSVFEVSFPHYPSQHLDYSIPKLKS